MEVSVEYVTESECRMRVEFPDDDLRKTVQERVETLAREVRIDGFRPGRVPISVVVEKYGESIQQEFLTEAISSVLTQALQQEQLSPVSKPQIDTGKPSEASKICFVATFQVAPRIELHPVEQLSVIRKIVTIQPADIDGMIDTLRRQKARWIPVDRSVQMWDRVTINYVGTVDGESFRGSDGKAFELIIGEGAVIPGLDEQLIGVEIGDGANMVVNVPDTYVVTEVRGKRAVFSVDILKIHEAELPELDDRLARDFGVAEGGMDAFRSHVEENMQAELKAKIDGDIKEQVMRQLLDLHKIAVPDADVDIEVAHIRVIAGEQGIDPGEDEVVVAQARKRVAARLLINALAQQHGITPTADQVRKKVEVLASGFEDPQEVVVWYHSSQENLAQVESLLLEELVIEYVLERCSIEQSESSFVELMRSA